MKVQLRRHDNRKLLYRAEIPDNTIMPEKVVLEKAIEAGVSLFRVDLKGYDLRGAYLMRADLSQANLRDADLRGADLDGANLDGANLACADFRNATLRGTSMRRANLYGADLREALPKNIDLFKAGLRGAKMSWTGTHAANYTESAGVEWAWYRDTQIDDGITVNRHPLIVRGLDWPIAIWEKHMTIGCMGPLPIETWAGYTEDAVICIGGETAARAWRQYRETILGLARADGRG